MSEQTFRFIILTGPPGCGKTTLIKKVCDVLKVQNIIMSGFFTEEVRARGKRVGFDLVLLNGQRLPLARVRSDACEKPMVGKYAVEVQSFESCVLPLLSSEDGNSILVLDEIGKMELLSVKFKESVFNCIKNGKNIILATVPVKIKKPIPLVEKIKAHPDTCLIIVNEFNRNLLVNKITNIIISTKEKSLGFRFHKITDD